MKRPFNVHKRPRTKAGRRSRGSFEVVCNFPLANREELMLLRDPSRYEGNQAWRVHSARKSAGWFIRGTSSGSVSLEKQLFPFKLRRIASTLGCVSRGRLAFLWTRSSLVYSILVAWPQKRRPPSLLVADLSNHRGSDMMFRMRLISGSNKCVVSRRWKAEFVV